MKYINKEKLEKIKINKDNFYVVTDFDKTITAQDSCDSWDASGNLLGEKFKQKSNEFYQRFRPIEIDYKISFAEKFEAMEKWYNSCMELFYEYNLTGKQLEKSIDSSNLIFRDGAKDFLYNMYKNNIPVIILSAGIGNVIKRFLENNNCLYSNIFIIANFITFDKNGKIERFQGDLIHTLNKTITGHLPKEQEEKISSKKYKMLFGDLIEDKNMLPKDEWNSTISVRFFK